MLLEKAIRAVCGNKQKNAGQKEMRVREPGVRIQEGAWGGIIQQEQTESTEGKLSVEHPTQDAESDRRIGRKRAQRTQKINAGRGNGKLTADGRGL